MKKNILISLVLTFIGFIPVIQQESTGCSAFGYEHLISPAVITSADACSSSLLALSLLPSVQISRFFHFDSAYTHYFLMGLVSFFLYALVGNFIERVKTIRVQGK